MLAQVASAADTVPYSIKSIKVVGSGFVELVGPGKTQVNDEIIPYEGTKYIRVTNIDAMMSVTGTTKGCMVSYSSEGYTETISVLEQSCDEVIEVLANAE